MRVVADFRPNLLLLYRTTWDAYATYITTNRIILITRWCFFLSFSFFINNSLFSYRCDDFRVNKCFFFFVSGDYFATAIRERACTTHESKSSSYKTATWQRSRIYVWKKFGDLLSIILYVMTTTTGLSKYQTASSEQRRRLVPYSSSLKGPFLYGND